jgi:hypothetical protein
MATLILEAGIVQFMSCGTVEIFFADTWRRVLRTLHFNRILHQECHAWYLREVYEA